MSVTLLPLCLLLGSIQTPQAPKSALEIVPLQHLCGFRPAIEPAMWGSLLRQPNNGVCHDLLMTGQSTESPIDPEQVVQMLGDLNRCDIDAERLGLTVQGDNVVVHGELAAVARVRQQVDAASAVLIRPLQVEVCVWDATDRDLASPVLGPREYAQFTANRSPLWRRLATTNSGGAASLDRQRWTRYVYDLDTEVAQKQSVSRPQTDAFCEGGRVVVRPHLLVGGDDLVLHVQFGLAQRRGVVRSLPTGLPGTADIELPLLETCFGGCSARIVNGGALAVSLRGNASSGGQIALTVRVMARTPPSAAGPAGVGIFPCSALTHPALTQRVSLPNTPPNDDQEGPSDPSPGFGYMETDQLIDLARSALDAQAADSVGIHAAGGYLFVRGEQPDLAAIEALLRSLQDRLLHNVTLRHEARLSARDDDAANPPGSAPTISAPTISAPTTTTPALLHEIVVPTLLGREVSVARILETNVVRGLDIYIAQEAGALDPNVQTLQIGNWLRARIAPLGSAHHLLLRAVCAQGAIPQARTVMPTGGILMPTDVASTRACHDGPVTSGQSIEHGDGPPVTLEGRSHRSAITTTLTW
ncbi:MAG: hypothetical protein ABIP94_17355 [Planctomycetota bacterium]